ncbi:unnamed protein product [Lactuca virosa]|uniref:Uncharacterized protein n=1 Tax=Lactuca virosa TaxID=75947 RepID=A0AAU9MSB9_9ASTR|nr:unnamed protein product [Lactuca virosa]
MSGKGVKCLIIGNNVALNNDKDKDKKKPTSRSSCTDLQICFTFSCCHRRSISAISDDQIASSVHLSFDVSQMLSCVFDTFFLISDRFFDDFSQFCC